jgi:hypothetical protein
MVFEGCEEGRLGDDQGGHGGGAAGCCGRERSVRRRSSAAALGERGALWCRRCAARSIGPAPFT